MLQSPRSRLVGNDVDWGNAAVFPDPDLGVSESNLRDWSYSSELITLRRLSCRKSAAKSILPASRGPISTADSQSRIDAIQVGLFLDLHSALASVTVRRESSGIELNRKPGQIEGVVVNDKRQPVAGIRTILIPDQDRGRIGLYKFAETDQAGRFTIRGITPGAYKVFAWEALEEWAFFDSDLMQRFERYGTPVRISESDELRTDVKLIPAGM